MRSPGIDARPITLISGSTHFCEVFFDDVEVPKENLVGRVNEGWNIAKRLLQHERDGLSAGRGEGASLSDLARTYVGVDAEGRIDDPDLRGRLIRHAMRARAFTMTMRRMATDIQLGVRPGALVSVLKNLGSEVAQERAELIVEILGPRGLGWSGEAYRDTELDAVRAWLHSRAFSIYGGSYEIQSNIIAKRVLGLMDHQ
jgi:alkylation response protein AidB-like acyl-CoA dehydrogenase